MPTTDSVSSTTNTKGIMGLGSRGSAALNDELIGKLKAADSRAQVDPIKKKVENNSFQKQELSALMTLMDNVNASFKELNNEALYFKRKVNSSGSSASVSVIPGVNIQNFNLDVKQVAQKDSFQSSRFKDSASLLGVEKDTSFNIEIRGVSHKIEVAKGATLQDLADSINKTAGFDVQARIIKVGGDKPYQLVLQSQRVGADNKISFSYEDKSTEKATDKTKPSTSSETVTPQRTPITNGILKTLGWDDNQAEEVAGEDGKTTKITNLEKNRLTTAQNAIFDYNGLEVVRDKNTIDDLRTGVTINLKETGVSNFAVVEDTEDIAKNLENMVSSYNTLIANLNITTGYDDKTGDSGAFQGVNDITTIRSSLNRIFSSQNSEGKSLDQYGITFDEKGVLHLDSKKLNDKLQSSVEDVRNFFVGYTKYGELAYSANSQVQTGKFTIDKDDLKINDISIKLETKDNATAEDNALALITAIKQAKIDGVYASLSIDKKSIVLKTDDGTSINITGKADKLQKLGMSETSLTASETKIVGLFSRLNTKLDELVGRDGSLSIYEARLNEESKKLSDEKEKIETSLNQKYDTMRERWALYAQQITALENQFSTLKTMIDFEINKK
ncbi:flagellar filament cap protein [Campylobacter pinnipediorum subsp. caledonicus]|uniref:Flagellar hook-associated protein 2 n=1 Tax=Campylobacter pinnipediorum subsp. caledonicus TaxID=1874362 RepID=A0A1S6U819_9BACT|nr:flagellar filament capping protein FliD [Campylobacter pinnipediorum]AQW87863.1 flagellar filament cap protein [Campylobacter pinnipediorum subsp. caledonicus]